MESKNPEKKAFRVPIETVQERMGRMPSIENYWNLSKDGKYLIHKTVFTDIKPLAFVEAVLKGRPVVEPVEAPVE